MIILRIRASNIDAVMGAGYDKLRIFRDVVQDAPFSDPPLASLNLLEDEEYYDYVDTTGDNDSWYEVDYYDSQADVASTKSAPIKGISASGPLGLLTTSYVKANTTLPDLQMIPDSQVAILIMRAEKLIELYGSRYGGFQTGCLVAQGSLTMAALMLVEELSLTSTPTARGRSTFGFQSEKIGSYSYSISAGSAAAKPRSLMDLIPVEAQQYMFGCLQNPPQYSSVVSTQVFVERNPRVGPLTPVQGPVVYKRAYQDYMDVEIVDLRACAAVDPQTGVQW